MVDSQAHGGIVLVDILELEELNSREIEQLQVLANSLRLKIFKELRSPKTVTEVAKALGLDRKPLYYQLGLLLEADLVKKTEQRQVGHILESVYKANDWVNFTRSRSTTPGPYEHYGNMILELSHDTFKDCHDSLQADPTVKAASRRIIMKIKSDDLETVPKQISQLMHEYINKVLELGTEDGDVEYSVTVTHFEMKK